MKLIFGLGNPGKEYEKTRHNIGFLVLDNYLGNVKWQKAKDCFFYETFSNGEKIIFVKPLTFMNLSGNCVRRMVDFYRVDLDNILVIHDDLDIPMMTYRLKYNSSSGGHNGIKSIIGTLHSQNFFRLKIGVGKSKDIPVYDFVLGKLSKAELDYIKDDIFKKIIDSFINDGYEKTINKYQG